MKFGRYELASLVLVLSGFGAVASCYERLPAMVPVHWDLDAVANGFMPKPLGAFIGPITSAALFAIFLLLPHISPKGFRIESFLRTYRIMTLAIQLFLLVFLMAQLLADIGFAVPIRSIGMASIGALVIVLGNLMGKVRKNLFVGIRTPWTLANDEVWFRANRLGGWLMVLAGFVFATAGLLGRGGLIGVAALGSAAIVPVIYSYIVSRQLRHSEFNTRQ